MIKKNKKKLGNFDPKRHRLYKPINISKYKGKSYPICRSSWEFSFCSWLDRHKEVNSWSSESVVIPYQDPMGEIRNGKIKQRRYYPDYLVEIKTREGTQTWLVEVKPYKETIQPKKTQRKSTKTILYEAKTWKVNQAKWNAAKKYCYRRKWIFKLITEKDLF